MKGKRVLVVEDDPGNASLAEALLAVEGLDVDHAANGLGALTRMEAARPDAILLDYRMPGMDGLECLREVRRRPEWRRIPVLVLSAAPEVEDLRHEFEALGPVRVAQKPMEPGELVETLKEMTRGGGA